MRWVMFCKAKPRLFRREVRTSAYVVVTLTDASAALTGQSIVTRYPSPQAHPDAATSRVAHQRERVRHWRADSPVCSVLQRLRTHCRSGHSAIFRCRVTSTLHGRNVKNIFAGKNPRASIAFRKYACNVAQVAAKFPQIPAVSNAVNSPTDCIMLDRNFTTRPHPRPSAATTVSRRALHRRDGALPPTAAGAKP
jgi:hypothetical protein